MLLSASLCWHMGYTKTEFSQLNWFRKSAVENEKDIKNIGLLYIVSWFLRSYCSGQHRQLLYPCVILITPWFLSKKLRSPTLIHTHTHTQTVCFKKKVKKKKNLSSRITLATLTMYTSKESLWECRKGAGLVRTVQGKEQVSVVFKILCPLCYVILYVLLKNNTS